MEGARALDTSASPSPQVITVLHVGVKLLVQHICLRCTKNSQLHSLEVQLCNLHKMLGSYIRVAPNRWHFTFVRAVDIS